MQISSNSLLLCGLVALGLGGWATAELVDHEDAPVVADADADADVAVASTARRTAIPPRARRDSLPSTPLRSGHEDVELEIDVATPPPARPTPAEADAAAAAHAAELGAKLEAESRDEGSTEIEAAVHEVLRDDAFAGSSLVDADCRTSLCRVEVQLDSEEAHDRFVSAVPTTRPFSTNGMIHRLQDADPPRAVVYFARRGYQI